MGLVCRGSMLSSRPSSCLDFMSWRMVQQPFHRTEHSWAAGDFLLATFPCRHISQAQNLALNRPLLFFANATTDGMSFARSAPPLCTRFMSISMVTTRMMLNFGSDSVPICSQAAFRYHRLCECRLSS